MLPRPEPRIPTIAWDVDDVLNDLTRTWLSEVFLSQHALSHVTYEALTANPPHEVVGISLAEYQISLDTFREKRQSSLAPDPVLSAWFEANGARYRHIALTATPLKNAHRSVGWVLEHFGRWIRTVTVLPSPRPGEDLTVYDATKVAHLCHLGNVAALVDDSPTNLIGIDRAGAIGILIPRPWNQQPGTVSEALRRLDHA